MADAFTLSQIQAMADLGEEEVNSHIITVEEMLLDYPKFQTTDAVSDKCFPTATGCRGNL